MAAMKHGTFFYFRTLCFVCKFFLLIHISMKLSSGLQYYFDYNSSLGKFYCFISLLLWEYWEFLFCIIFDTLDL